MKANLLLAQYSNHDKNLGYEVRSNLKNFTVEQDTSLYCIQFELAYTSRACSSISELSALTRPGGAVCALCTSKAVRAGEERCRGSGEPGGVTTWRMLIHPHCHGRWRQVLQTQECDCPQESSFVFA